MNKNKLYEKGIEEVKRSYAIFENALFLALIALGFLGMYPISISELPFVSILYVIFAMVMLAFLLRKYLYTDCYYYDN